MVIIGFSDIITNSSSEVYCYYSKEGINRIKELVDSILKVAGSDKKFDDLFEISLVPDEYSADDFYEEYGREPIDSKELEEYALNYQNYADRPAFIGLQVTAKDTKNQEAANLISFIDSIFDYREYYT